VLQNIFVMSVFLTGVSYLDLPGNLLAATVKRSQVLEFEKIPRPPKPFPETNLVAQAAKLLMSAKRPLIITGKGELLLHLIKSIKKKRKKIKKIFEK